MQKEVVIFLESIQKDEFGLEDKVEIVTGGQYYLKNGKHYFIYEETSEDGKEKMNSMVKVSADGSVEVIRRGTAGVHMTFKEGEESSSYYDTPYGNMFITIDAKRVEFQMKEEECVIGLEYGLDVNYQHTSDCMITIRAESKDTCKISLGS